MIVLEAKRKNSLTIFRRTNLEPISPQYFGKLGRFLNEQQKIVYVPFRAVTIFGRRPLLLTLG